MGKYYYLISGLPELQLDDQKLKISMADFKTELQEQLSDFDKKLISLFFMQFDNINLLRFLNDREADLHPLGNLDQTDFQEILLLFGETDNPKYPNMPAYFKKFIPAYLNNQAVFQNMSNEDQLASLYYDYALACDNNFISDWYSFNLTVNNILTAINCRKHGFDRETAIVGTNEISEAIRYSNSRDFGITHLFAETEEILRIAENTDIYERERKIDQLKWDWLEEKGFFHFFDVEHLLMYLVKIEMLARWVQLEKATGLKVFREMIERLQHSFEFPNEFTIKKVK